MNTHERHEKHQHEGSERSERGSSAKMRVGGGRGRMDRRVRELAGKVPEMVRDVPKIIERELSTHPYRMLGVAALVGGGVGLFAGSRLVRFLVTSASSYALAELSKMLVRKYIDGLGENEADFASQ